MKSLVVRFSLILSVVLMVIGAGSVLAQGDAPQPIFGAVNIIVPEAYMTLTDGSETRLIAPTSFEAGETLRTDEAGVALITWFYDGTETVLGQNSSLTLNGFSGAAGENYLVDLELSSGHLVAGIGDVAAGQSGGSFTVTTPAFQVRLVRGHFEVTVAEDGTTMLVVTDGRTEVLVEDAEPFAVDGSQFLVGEPGTAQTLSDDGVTPNLTGVCTATAPTNLNVRLYPDEDSRRLGGVSEGQVLWVRASTEGNLWVQVYFQTAEDDEEGHNSGWLYGPAVTLDEANCGTILRAPLDAMIYGGEGVDQPGAIEDETEPIS